MLTKKDKNWIKDFLLSEAFENMLGNMVMKAMYQSQEREMTFDDGKTEPGRTIEKTVKVNVIDQIVKYLPFVEGALRGLQEDLDKAKNNISGNNARLEAIGNILIGMESGAKSLAMISDEIKKRLPPPDKTITTNGEAEETWANLTEHLHTDHARVY